MSLRKTIEIAGLPTLLVFALQSSAPVHGSVDLASQLMKVPILKGSDTEDVGDIDPEDPCGETDGVGGSNSIDCEYFEIPAAPEIPANSATPAIPARGSLGDCNRPYSYANMPEMTFLAPATGSESITTREFPTFLVYLPFDLADDSSGKFVLETSDGSELYSQTFHNEEGNSILQITLPSELSNALEVDQTYLISFRVYCNDPTMSNSTSLSARERIHRVEITSGTAWYDNLADVYRSGSTDDFYELLESVDDLTDIPEALSNTNIPNLPDMSPAGDR
jgi:hypothetical protein